METSDLLFWVVAAALAIDNFTQILTEQEIFAGCRVWFERHFPKIKKLASCKFCQSCWLSLAIATVFLLQPDFVPLRIFLVWMATHRMVQFLDEFYVRYLSRSPTNIFANVRMVKDEEPQDDNTK